jgi:hypothetical protein
MVNISFTAMRSYEEALGLTCELRPHPHLGCLSSPGELEIIAILKGGWDQPIRSHPVVGALRSLLREHCLRGGRSSHTGFAAVFVIL